MKAELFIKKEAALKYLESSQTIHTEKNENVW